MREEIRERIEMIQNGEVPEGYIYIKDDFVPAEWKVARIGDICKLSSGTTPSRKNINNFKGNILWVTSGELKNKYVSDTIEKINESVVESNNLKIYEKGTFIIALYGLEAAGIRGTGSIVKKDCTISQACMAFTELKKVIGEYMYYWYENYGEMIGLKYAQGTKQQNLSTELISNLSIILPSIEEQKKIIEILNVMDFKMNKVQAIITEKEKQKKWLKQNLLSGKRRLKEFEDKWKNIKLADIFYEIDERTEETDEYPILTSSRKGMFFQSDYFNKQVASQNNTGYKIIREGQFTYRAMSDDGNYTFNVQNLCCKGIVSPAYSVFSINNQKANDYYIYQFLNDYSFTRYLRILQQGGTRQSLNFDKLCNVEVKLPALNEQNAIANILFKANQEIELLQQQLKLLTLEKKAMMQLLLTGIIRVN